MRRDRSGGRGDRTTARRLLCLARTGGAWSPAAHRHWPPAFKRTARALLLCAAAGRRACVRSRKAAVSQRAARAAARSRQQGSHPEDAARPLSGRQLHSLPPNVLLHVIKVAAEPFSYWMTVRRPMLA